MFVCLDWLMREDEVVFVIDDGNSTNEQKQDKFCDCVYQKLDWSQYVPMSELEKFRLVMNCYFVDIN